MNFFKSVFSDEPTPPNSPKSRPELPKSPPETPNSDSQTRNPTWNSFGGLIKNLATKSDFVIQTYRRDLQEIGSGLRKETALIREAASRAVDVGASVAQESLESVGKAVDDIGASVWKSTAQIISRGTETIVAFDSNHDNDSDFGNNDGNNNINEERLPSLDSKRYSRFDTQLGKLQCDLSTYCAVPDDEVDYERWRSEFLVLEEKREEIESFLTENQVIREIYNDIVPSKIDNEGFWSRYFYRVDKLKQAEEARALLVKRAISGEEEENLSWDFDDEDDDNEQEGNGFSSRGAHVEKLTELSGSVEVGNVNDEESVVEKGKIENLGQGISGVDKDENKLEEKVVVEGNKGDNGGSCRDSDVSVVSTQSSLPEEEDLGWDEIEDIGSNDEIKGESVRSTTSASIVDLHKRLSAPEEEEDLSWDIEDEEDEPVKP